MRKVTIVVLVLITSCHVSEKPNIGPLMPHATTISAAQMNAHGDPTMLDVEWANFWNQPREPDPLSAEGMWFMLLNDAKPAPALSIRLKISMTPPGEARCEIVLLSVAFLLKKIC